MKKRFGELSWRQNRRKTQMDETMRISRANQANREALLKRGYKEIENLDEVVRPGEDLYISIGAESDTQAYEIPPGWRGNTVREFKAQVAPHPLVFRKIEQ